MSNAVKKEDQIPKPSTLASYKDLFERLNDPILLLDFEDLRVLEANIASEQFFNQSLEVIKTINLYDYIPSEEKEFFTKELRVIKRRYHPRIMEKTWMINGVSKVLEINACPLTLEDETLVLQLLIKDITELRKSQQALLEMNKKLEEIATTDAMTGLYNFRYFSDALVKENERAGREGSNYSVILMDVDNFKHYNDNNGHPEGDKLLKQLADILRKSVRNIDIPARYGGEEFVVICPNTNPDQALVVAERIRSEVAKFPFFNREKQPLGIVSVSIGISTFPLHTTEYEQMKKKADMALYHSKHGGRNRITVYSE